MELCSHLYRMTGRLADPVAFGARPVWAGRLPRPSPSTGRQVTQCLSWLGCCSAQRWSWAGQGWPVDWSVGPPSVGLRLWSQASPADQWSLVSLEPRQPLRAARLCSDSLSYRYLPVARALVRRTLAGIFEHAPRCKRHMDRHIDMRDPIGHDSSVEIGCCQRRLGGRQSGRDARKGQASIAYISAPSATDPLTPALARSGR